MSSGGANLFAPKVITPEGSAKILDFGLAKRMPGENSEASLTQTGTILGTLRSISPEQGRGEAVDARSDLFALGVLLYEMFTGISTFQDDNPLRTIQKVKSSPAASPLTLRKELPERLSSLISSWPEETMSAGRPGNTFGIWPMSRNASARRTMLACIFRSCWAAIAK